MASADAAVVVVVIVAMLKQVGALWLICDEMGSHVLD
jgi:hypothetical protein